MANFPPNRDTDQRQYTLMAHKLITEPAVIRVTIKLQRYKQLYSPVQGKVTMGRVISGNFWP